MRRLALVPVSLAVAAAATAAPPRVTQVRVGSAPYRFAGGGRTLWVALNGAGAIARVNPNSGRVVAQYSVGGGPAAIAVSGSAIWIGNYARDGRIMRLDVRRRRVRRIKIGVKPIAVDADAESVWVADAGDGRVTKLSARTGKVLLRRSFPGELHEGLAVQPDGVWTSSENGVVRKLDPTTGKPLLTVRVGDDADYIYAAGGSIWVSCYADDRVWRLDPAMGTVLQTITVGTGMQGMALAGTALWVADYDHGRVVHVDASNGRVTERLRTGPRPRGVVVAGDSVWVANGGGSTLTRVRLG